MSQLLVYLSRQQLQIFNGGQRRMPRLLRTGADPDGAEACNGVLAQHGVCRLDLILDVADEEFQIVMLPRLRAADQRQLLQRKLQQVFAGTPYRCAAGILTRDAGERQVPALLSGLHDPQWIEHWLSILTAHGAVLDRMLTPALLLQGVLQHLPVRAAHVLLFQVLEQDMVRQSCLVDGHIRFSRLLPLPLPDGRALARQLLREADLARQYLQGLRLLQQEDSVEMIIVGPPGLRSSFTGLAMPQDRLLLRWLDHRELAAAGCRVRPEQEDAPASLVALARDYHGHHYLPALHRRAARRVRLQQAERQASALFLGITLLSMPAAAWMMSEQERQLRHVRSRLAEVRQALAVRQAPAAALPPGEAGLASRVQALQEVRRWQQQVLHAWPVPQTSLSWLSTVLERHPSLHAERIRWSCTWVGDGAQRQRAASVAGYVTGPVCQPVLELAGYLHYPDQSLSGWQQHLLQLRADLEAGGRHRLEWLRLPFDLRASAHLRLEAGDGLDSTLSAAPAAGAAAARGQEQARAAPGRRAAIALRLHLQRNAPAADGASL